MKKSLDELLDYIQPQPYIVHSENYNSLYETPVLTAGQTFVLGKINETDGVYPASKAKPIILFDDFTTACKWVDFPFKVKSSACKIIVPKNDANIRYCYYAMKSIKFDASQHKRYWISQYSKLQIPSYSSEEESFIVNSLDGISSLIQKKKTELESLDSLVKSRFMEMFGDVLRNNKNFEICPFGEYIDQMNIGPFGSDLKNDSFVPKEQSACMVYEQKHAIEKTLDVPTRYVNSEKYAYLKRFEIGPGDIIVSCRGTIGECWILPKEAPRGIIHPSLMLIKPKDFVNHEFLLHMLERILSEQTQQGSGVKMAIKAKDLSKINCIKPSRDMQDSFVNFVHLVDKSRFDQRI